MRDADNNRSCLEVVDNVIFIRKGVILCDDFKLVSKAVVHNLIELATHKFCKYSFAAHKCKRTKIIQFSDILL